jgi:hypothetical protein
MRPARPQNQSNSGPEPVIARCHGTLPLRGPKWALRCLKREPPEALRSACDLDHGSELASPLRWF